MHPKDQKILIMLPKIEATEPNKVLKSPFGMTSRRGEYRRNGNALTSVLVGVIPFVTCK